MPINAEERMPEKGLGVLPTFKAHRMMKSSSLRSRGDVLKRALEATEVGYKQMQNSTTHECTLETQAVDKQGKALTAILWYFLEASDWQKRQC